MGKPIPRGKKHDWGLLKIEWLQSTESLNQFRARKGIAHCWFYRKVQQGKWREAKDRIQENSMRTLEKTAARAISDKWKDYRKIWTGAKAQAFSILRKTFDNEGHVTRPLSTAELAQLVKAMFQVLQGESFISGGPTERVENRNLHLDVVNLIQEIEKGNDLGHGSLESVALTNITQDDDDD